MKKIDVFRLAWNELKFDRRNMFFAFILEVLLFSNAIILLLLLTGIDSVFDSYCQEHITEVYNVTVFNIDESILHELTQDGFRDMELCYDEREEKYFTYAKMDSLIHLDYKIMKWRSKGVVVRASMQEIVNIMIFIKAIFAFVSVLGVLLCIFAIANFYQMKVQKRVKFSNMLIRIGMPSKKIGRIYRIPFIFITICSIITAYVLSFPILEYFNNMIRLSFAGVSISTEIRGQLALLIGIVEIVLLFCVLGNKWSKLSKQ